LEQNTPGFWQVLEGQHEKSESLITARVRERQAQFGNRWTEFLTVVEAALNNSGQDLPLSWDDEIRCMELDDALRQSVEKRRAINLEYVEVSGEAGTKGTITLIGCGMIWLMLVVFAVSIWVPWIKWLIVPMLLAFLALLAIQWLAKKA
jgi:hypothetical protein